MNMPQFTAEASLGTTQSWVGIWDVGKVGAPQQSLVIPAQDEFAIAVCKACARLNRNPSVCELPCFFLYF